MKILIVSGFLGAGKTTFIQTMAKAVGRDFVVYENEYAGAGVDTKRLAETDQLSVFESTENCVCCSGKADFASSVLTISCSLDPEYLIVEPTGLARLSNILDNVRQILYGNLTLLQPITIVDAAAFARHRRRYPEIYLDQVRTASRILISKVGSVLPEELTALERELAELNPGAELIARPYSALEPAWFHELLSRALDAEGNPSPAEPEQTVETPMEQMSLTDVSLPSPVHLIAFLNALAWGRCGSVLRAKGNLPCGKEWLQFDLVDGIWQFTGGRRERRSECVLIGNQILREEVRRRLLTELVFGTKDRPHRISVRKR